MESEVVLPKTVVLRCDKCIGKVLVDVVDELHIESVGVSLVGIGFVDVKGELGRIGVSVGISMVDVVIDGQHTMTLDVSRVSLSACYIGVGTNLFAKGDAAAIAAKLMTIRVENPILAGLRCSKVGKSNVGREL